MYDNIVSRQKEKREKVREQSLKITKEMSKPFSFYTRDMVKIERKKQIINENVDLELKMAKRKQNFQAKDVPISSKVEMLPQMQKRAVNKRQ